MSRLLVRGSATPGGGTYRFRKPPRSAIATIIRRGRHRMRVYMRYGATALNHVVGFDSADSFRLSDGTTGHICYGPYHKLSAGTYTAGFYVQKREDTQSGVVQIDVCCDVGRKILASRDVRVDELFFEIPRLIAVDFDLCEPTTSLEARLFVNDGVLVAVRDMVIFSRSPAYRSVQ